MHCCRFASTLVACNTTFVALQSAALTAHIFIPHIQKVSVATRPYGYSAVLLRAARLVAVVVRLHAPAVYVRPSRVKHTPRASRSTAFTIQSIHNVVTARGAYCCIYTPSRFVRVDYAVVVVVVGVPRPIHPFGAHQKHSPSRIRF